MAPMLPRVSHFPIVGEKSALTILGTGLTIPAAVQDDCPLIGKLAPELVLPDHLGRRCSLHATIALGRPIILFFFPLAGSPHCTKESCMFRDALGVTPIFSDLQAIIIGISQDPPARSKRFVDEHHLGYLILHDERREAMDAYGVPRTMMGLIDQRCTFVIDPSGTVRSMVQGVLDANGHVKFAERWLIRLEDELSQRTRKMIAFDGAKENLMLGDDVDRQVRMTYGDSNSAQIGGIDAAPRYGAASNAKLPSVSQRSRADRHREEKAHVNLSELPLEDAAPRTNMWKNWKNTWQQLSSSDDKPPPLAMQRYPSKAASDETKVAPTRRKGGRGFAQGFSRTISRSQSRSNLKQAAKEEETRRSSFSRRRSIGSQQAHVELLPSVDAVPPLPPLYAALEEVNGAPKAGANVQNEVEPGVSLRTGATPVTEVDQSDRETSVWGTDSSLSSHVSTAATSLPGSRLSHADALAGNRNGSTGWMQNGQQYIMAEPTVTSEILMPGEVLDLKQDSLPLVIKEDAAPSRNALNGASSPLPPPVPPKRTVSRKAVARYSDEFGSSSETTPVKKSVDSAVMRQSPSNNTLHDDSPAEKLLDETDGQMASIGRPSSRSAHVDAAPLLMSSGRSLSQQSFHSSGRSTPAFGGKQTQPNGFYTTPSSPYISSGDEARNSDVEEFNGASGSSLYRSSFSRPSAVTDVVHRIAAAPQSTDAMHARMETGSSFIGKGDIEGHLSPRPRSAARLGESQVTRDGRLRRPMNPPKDIPALNNTTRLARHTRQLSLTDTQPSARKEGQTNADVEQLQSTSDQPVAAPPLSPFSRTVADSAIAPAMDSVSPTSSPRYALTSPAVSASATSSEGNNSTLPSSDDQDLRSGDSFSHTVTNKQQTSSAREFGHMRQDDRRPSASSLGTFGRRASTRGSDEEEE